MWAIVWVRPRAHKQLAWSVFSVPLFVAWAGCLCKFCLFPLRPARSSRVVGGELSLLARIRFSLKHRGRIDVCLCSFDGGLVLVKGPFTRKLRVAVRPRRSQFCGIGCSPLPVPSLVALAGSLCKFCFIVTLNSARYPLVKRRPALEDEYPRNDNPNPSRLHSLPEDPD